MNRSTNDFKFGIPFCCYYLRYLCATQILDFKKSEIRVVHKYMKFKKKIPNLKSFVDLFILKYLIFYYWIDNNHIYIRASFPLLNRFD